jgi:hypothetical protein
VQYQLAFSYYVGQKPNGWTNLLLLTICLSIPAVGPIVILGYQAEVTEWLLRDPDRRRYPDFNFDRFTRYLERGIWPFVIHLVGTLIGLPVIMLACIAAFSVAAAANALPLGILAAIGVVLAGSILFTALLSPLTFHAEVANRFDLGGGFRFTLDFWKRVGGAAVVAYFVSTIMGMAVCFVGLLVCFFGLYPAASITGMASQHLMTQLYVLYLDRGGEEIVKTERRRRRYEDEDADEDDGGYDIEDDRRRRD